MRGVSERKKNFQFNELDGVVLDFKSYELFTFKYFNVKLLKNWFINFFLLQLNAMLTYSTNTRKCPIWCWIFFHPMFIPRYRAPHIFLFNVNQSISLLVQ